MNASVTLSHDWFPRSLPANVAIGERSWVWSSFAFLHYRSQQPCGVFIGNDTGIYLGTFFELGPDGKVEIGDYCTIIGTVIACNSRVVIGDYSLIAREVVIADRLCPAPPSIENVASVGARDLKSESSIAIGANTWIGTRAVLLRGARIGQGSIVGAAAVVDFEVPPYSIAAGNPAKVISTIERTC